MKATFNTRWIIAAIVLLAILLSGFFFMKWSRKPGMNINCSTVIHYDHANPDYISTLEMVFRLDRDYDGLVVLSGILETPSGKQIVSRNITFDYEVKIPGEISVRNMKYSKTLRDTAQDAFVTRSFFFVPEGTSRQLRLSPLGNAWLIGNLQSPFALCVNKKN